MTKPYVYVGIDLGQRRDYSAIAVLEPAEVLTGEFDYEYRVPKKRLQYFVRHLERLRRGSPYPEVVHRIDALVRKLSETCYVVVAVDAGGPGMPVVDLLRKAHMPCTLNAVIITGGSLEARVHGVYTVPRKDLLQTIKLVLQTSQLRIPAEMPGSKDLLEELGTLKLTGGGDNHDDLAFALSLALWRARKGKTQGKSLDEILPHF